MAQLLFFGRFRELGDGLGSPPVEVATLGALRAWIVEQAPEIGDALEQGKARIAVDGEIVFDDALALDGVREVAFLPPMSGG